MGIDFSVIAGMLLYGIFIKLLVTGRLGARAAAVSFVFVYSVLFPAIIGSLFGTIGQLFTISSIVGIVLQLAVVYGVFYKLERLDEDSFLALLGWCTGGAVVVFFVVPYVSAQLLANV